MATTATRTFEIALAPGIKIQGWRVSIGGADTTASWKTGMYAVSQFQVVTQSDQAIGGVIPNSSDGTENTQAGTCYVAGLANSTIMDCLVFGN